MRRGLRIREEEGRVVGYFEFDGVGERGILQLWQTGVSDRLWSVEDLVALWEAYEQRRAERAA